MANVFDEFDTSSQNAFDEFDTSVNAFDEFDSDDPTLGEIGTGLVADVAISESGKLAGAAIGTAIAPGIGTVIGYTIGALGSGATGSIAAQRIEGRDEISYGRVVADSLINLIPGSKAAKSTRFAVRAGQALGKGAVVGAGIGAGGVAVETAIDEQRLPTMDELRERGIGGAALGGALGVSGEAFSKAYQKFAGLPTRKLDEALKLGDKDAKLIVDGVERNAKQYGEEVQKQYSDAWKAIQERYSDENIRARVLQEQTGGGQYTSKKGIFKVRADDEDYYLQRRLAEAKIEAKNQEVADAIRVDQDFLQKKANETGQDAQALSDGIDDYLHAKHAIDYNRRLGDGAAGISTEQARQVVNKFEGARLNQELAGALEIRKGLSRKILDTLEDGGLVSKQLADKLRKENPDYVPLNRVMSEDSTDEAIRNLAPVGGIRYESKGTGLKRAKGSEREVMPITENIYTNLVEATRRAEINKANQAFKKMVESNPDQSLVQIRKPKIKGTRLVKDESAEAKRMRERGERVKSKKAPIYEDAGNNVLTIFENGQRYFAEIADPKLARAMKGMNRKELSSILRIAQQYNRFVGGLYTRFNPEFLIPNLFRDRSEAFVNNAAKMDILDAAKTLSPRQAAQDMNTIRKALMDVEPQTPEEFRLRELYREFRKSGGSSGGLGLTTIKDVEKQISELAKGISSPTKQKVRKLNEIVSGINEIVEDATRFGTYRNAINSGMTKDQAALAARNSSFDPLLQGSEGDTLRALYLFANPALQGAKNFLRSMSKPKVALGVMGGLTAITMSLDKWNQMQDEDWREKIASTSRSNWKINKNLIIVTGTKDDGTLDYISIPIGYSMTPFKVIADYAQRLATGQDVGSPESLAAEVGQEIVDSYNPMGGSPVPTILRPLTELATNKDGLGRDIRPSWLEERTMSATERVYPWTAQTQGGEVAMALADSLKDMGYETSPENLLYLYQTWFGGPGKTVERLFNVTSKLYEGKPLDKREIPIARRFYGETYAQAFERRTGRMQDIKEIDKQEGTESAKASRIASNIFDVYRDAPPEARAGVLRDQLLGNPDVNESVLRRLDNRIKDFERGITTEDKEIRAMNTASRAEYYLRQSERLDRDEYIQYLQEHQQKGILTPDVERQMIASEQFKSYIQGR